MKKQRGQPVPRTCGLNSESKEGVMQAKMGGTGPELDQPHVEFVLHSHRKGKFNGCLKQGSWGAGEQVMR